MPRIAYVNGRYLPPRRGLGPYRGSRLSIRRRRLRGDPCARRPSDRCRAAFRPLRPLARRARASARPCRGRPSRSCCASCWRCNGIENGLLYFQATRGVAPRDHKFPRRARPRLVATAKLLKPLAPGMLEKGVAVITIPDIRWRRCDIKSLALLPNVLGKQQAVRRAPTRPGRWMTTAMSPRAPRPMPGS